jgi:hypothetical protein
MFHVNKAYFTFCLATFTLAIFTLIGAITVNATLRSGKNTKYKRQETHIWEQKYSGPNKYRIPRPGGALEQHQGEVRAAFFSSDLLLSIKNFFSPLRPRFNAFHRNLGGFPTRDTVTPI